MKESNETNVILIWCVYSEWQPHKTEEEEEEEVREQMVVS